MANNRVGIDLGTYQIKLYRAKDDSIETLRNAVAIRNKKEVAASGDEAYYMYERAPQNISVIFPMACGVISDYDAMQFLLQDILKNEREGFFHSTSYLLAAPSDVTEVESRALYSLLLRSEARARQVHVVEKTMADAVGIGLDVLSDKPFYIVNIGGGSTEYSIIASGGIVYSRMDRTGGRDLDQAIASYVRREYNFKLGIFACEELKNTLGTAYGVRDIVLNVPGRSLVTGIPGEVQINSHEVYTAIRPMIDRIKENCMSVFDRIPPEMVRTIRREGIHLCGGTAELQNIDLLLERELNIPVSIAPEAALTTVYGLREVLADKEYLPLTHSMTDEKRRWIG